MMLGPSFVLNHLHHAWNSGSHQFSACARQWCSRSGGPSYCDLAADGTARSVALQVVCCL
jgi:hypothetical protein